MDSSDCFSYSLIPTVSRITHILRLFSWLVVHLQQTKVKHFKGIWKKSMQRTVIFCNLTTLNITTTTHSNNFMQCNIFTKNLEEQMEHLNMFYE